MAYVTFGLSFGLSARGLASSKARRAHRIAAWCVNTTTIGASASSGPAPPSFLGNTTP